MDVVIGTAPITVGLQSTALLFGPTTNLAPNRGFEPLLSLGVNQPLYL